MTITGIVAEYNPFHNGHLYQLAECKKHADAVVVIMSGSFVQRGDVALFDKWTRTTAALQNGADLVLELPVCYSVQTAERFARGAVETLSALGVVDSLCFGSESGELSELEKAAELLLREPAHISQKLKTALSEGYPYPVARRLAFDGEIPAEILNAPNNILALEYLCAIKESGSSIKPYTIKRIGAGYHDTDTSGTFASATAIRQAYNNKADISTLVPESAYTLYHTAVPHNISALDTTITALLRTTTPEFLRTLPDVTEGLEYRFIEAAREHSTFSAIAEAVKTKRYPLSRIRRIMVNALLGIDASLPKTPPAYIRVLGMNKTGQTILKEAKKKSSLPIITKTADYKNPSPLFLKDVRSSDLAVLCADASEKRAGADYLKGPVIV